MTAESKQIQSALAARNSPDLNPKENAWNLMEGYVARRARGI